MLPLKNKKEGPDIPIPGTSSPFSAGKFGVGLALADSKHFRTAHRAHALGRRFTIFHGYHLGILHLPFSAALYTISLHVQASYPNFTLKIY